MFGWLGGLGLTQLYKIIPFLTWLGRYGSRLGRASVPRVQDLVRERRGGAWFVLYFAATVLAGGFALSGSALGFRTCIALVALATAGLVSEYWRAWRSYYSHAHPSEPSIPPVIAKRGD